jgi:DNA modification methylase
MTLDSPLWDLLDAPVIAGDCVEVMAAMEPDCIDAIVCDPPYGLEFMGREWDRIGDVRQPGDATFTDVGGRSKVRYGVGASYGTPASAARAMQEWHARWTTEALRVLKPGGHLLAFGGTRTYHRLTCALEDTGFEIRDCLTWLYGQGFPKSLDAERAIAVKTCTLDGRHFPRRIPPADKRLPGDHVCPVTPESGPWTGWGTALRPGWEPIVVARKPLGSTIAHGLMTHGTGAINIGGSRLGNNGGRSVHADGGELALGGASAGTYGDGLNGAASAPLVPGLGRFPANVVLSHMPGCRRVGEREVPTGVAVNRNRAPGTMSSWLGTRESQIGDDVTYGQDGREAVPAWDCEPGCPVAGLDEQAGTRTSGANPSRRGSDKFRTAYGDFAGERECEPARGAEKGGASRFFATFEPDLPIDDARFYYCPKADRAEREVGLEDLDRRAVFRGELPNNPRCRLCDLDRVAGRSDAPACSCPEPDFEDDRDTARANDHPTVKPIDLMRWLIGLVTAKGALVLDPFVGSGTTGAAAALEGREFVGIERDAGYLPIARKRVEFWRQQPEGADVDAVIDAHAKRLSVAATGQIGLFG